MPPGLTLARDRVERLARVHRAPHHGQAGPGVDPAAEQGGRVDDDLGQRVHQVGGQVRPGGVPAGAGQLDVDRVGGRGERARAHADQAGRQLRVAVQRVDGGDVLESAGRDQLGRSGGNRLLGALEDQADPAREPALAGELLQGQAEAEHHRGVHVMTARVRDLGHRRLVGHVLEVLQRQRVEVGPERDHPVTLADVADHAVALGQQTGRQAGHGELTGDQGRRLELVVGRLGVRVQVPSNGYELLAVRGEPAVELAGQWLGTGQRPGPLLLGPLGLRQSSSHVGFRITLDVCRVFAMRDSLDRFR